MKRPKAKNTKTKHKSYLLMFIATFAVLGIGLTTISLAAGRQGSLVVEQCVRTTGRWNCRTDLSYKISYSLQGSFGQCNGHRIDSKHSVVTHGRANCSAPNIYQVTGGPLNCCNISANIRPGRTATIWLKYNPVVYKANDNKREKATLSSDKI